MAVGEIILAAFVQALFKKLVSRELLNFAHREGIHKKLQKWSTTLSTILVVLNDAEEKQLTSSAVKLWLNDLRDLAYDVEDVLDKFSTELLRRKIVKLHQASASKVWSLNLTCFTSSSRSAYGLFMFNMDSEINKITGRLQDLSQRKDKLGLNDIGGLVMEWKRPPNSSFSDGPVIGRDEDKKKIIELLLKDEQSFINFDVVGIVGMPGVGKTTLAGLIFNDDDAIKCFEIKVWVCVSDDFDFVRLTKAILKSITLESENFDELNELQDRLSKVLAGKRFLIIMDDVWNTDYGLWATFQSPFQAGAPGSKVVVTTRDVNVAKLMGAVECYNLECVSDNDCWKVFVQHAFFNRNVSEPPNLESLREKIVVKCNGLPLAARTLGGLLRCREIDEWEDILSNRLWTQADQSNILPLLRLSYQYLPSHIKRCFAYCSILPKDYEFEEKQLILLWMAEGLIQQPEGSKQMEDLGGEYFRELFSRSFFQKSRKDESKYVMHDLINDLAQWVAGEISFRLEDKLVSDKQYRIFEKARHSSYISAEFDGIQRLGAFSKVEHLRTFLPLTQSYHERKYLNENITLHILPKLQYLRVLSLKGYNITRLPDSICELKLLRYLDLSYTDITSLPESISSLYNLQTLLLESCEDLDELPTSMEKLTNLRHLNISNLRSLKGMPPGIGKLANLQTLSDFVVSKDSGSSGVGELGPLLHLSGILQLSGLENVNGAKDAAIANLVSKNGIDVLKMQWDNKWETDDPDVLEMLQPPRELKELTVIHYGGPKFPSWMGNPLFANMVRVILEGCHKCRFLPPLGQLVSLKVLIVRNMSGVESVGSEFYGEGCMMPFPSLETLWFECMENWKDWFPVETNDSIEGFPKLKVLFVRRCRNLGGKLPKRLPSLTKLVVYKCEELVVSIPSSQMLGELDIKNCKEVGCENEGLIQRLTRVEDLKAFGCKELTSLRSLEIDDHSQHLTLVGEETGDVQLWMPTKLETLKLRHFYNISKVPEMFHLTLLQELHILHCPSLASFPEFGLPSSLRVLQIESCASLLFLARGNVPLALKRLSISFCKNLESLVQEKYSSNNNCSPCLESLEIKYCPSLTSISSASGSLPPRLKHLHISHCGVLQCLAPSKLPNTLKHLSIENCDKLISFSSEGKLPNSLEHLQIWSCNMLTSLSSEGELPMELRHLSIFSCEQLISITDRFNGNTCLGCIVISHCQNLRCLPDGLHHLMNLSKLEISSCKNLVSFPDGGLPVSNLRDLLVENCENLVAFPKGFHNLNFLQKLNIHHCEGLKNLLEQQGFPPNLTSLVIWKLKVTKPLFQWGLHRLNSLRQLEMHGEAEDLATFPPEEWEGMMVLPKSLIHLRISGFQNLEKLSSGFQCLTSLEYLTISFCGKLKSFPEGGLPLSLLKFEVTGCQLLEEQCRRNKGRLWPQIAQIPCVKFENFPLPLAD